jgi:hypothetical protein
MNWATQIAAWLAKTASPLIFWVVLEVDQPPHANPITMATMAPQISPQTPYLTFTSVSAFIDQSFLNGGRFFNPSATPAHSIIQEISFNEDYL